MGSSEDESQETGEAVVVVWLRLLIIVIGDIFLTLTHDTSSERCQENLDLWILGEA